MSDVQVDVTLNPTDQRYEAVVDGRLAGMIAFEEREDALVMHHTEVGDAYEGQGVGSALVREALADVRRRGLGVVPTCPFVAAWLERHPEEQDLVRPGGDPA